MSDSRVVKVWSLAGLDGIDISPELVRCYRYDNTNRVSVLRVFAESTSYSVEDESIAPVDFEGIVTGRRIGQTYLVMKKLRVF